MELGAIVLIAYLAAIDTAILGVYVYSLFFK